MVDLGHSPGRKSGNVFERLREIFQPRGSPPNFLFGLLKNTL